MLGFSFSSYIFIFLVDVLSYINLKHRIEELLYLLVKEQTLILKDMNFLCGTLQAML